VVKYLAGPRAIKTHQEFDQRGFSGTGGAHKGNRFTSVCAEGNSIQGERRGRLVLEANCIKAHPTDVRQNDRMSWTGLLFHLQDGLEIVERDLRLAIDVDDIPQFLERAEDKEGIDPKREKLTYRNLPGKDQVKHQKQNAGT